jgi:nicotinamidase-related amidase
MTLPDEVAVGLGRRGTALLLIDLQRRHLDVDGVGYHTLPPERARSVTAQAGQALRVARAAGLPVVHVATWQEPASPWGPREGRNPFWAWQNGQPIVGASFVRQAGKCLAGSPYAEFMPDTEPAPGEPVVVKFRYSGFYMTDLDLVLRSFGVTHLVVAGVNTNNCVLHTCFDAHARDYAVVLLEDACGSMNGPEFHDIGVRQIAASVGWVCEVGQFATILAGGAEQGGW